MSALKKFQQLLRTLFQFDCTDLDFGIYRILNYKRECIEAFIARRLPQIVDKAFADYAAKDKEPIEQKIEQVRQQIRDSISEQAFDKQGKLKSEFRSMTLGKQFLALCDKLTQYEVAGELKTRVYNDLYNFFSRYYEDGDFVSMRRYGHRESYAIPYNGEEVVLHWANKDQYYIKTGEQFKTYRFKKVEGCTVTFELRNADTEQNNNKGHKRYFVLADQNSVQQSNGLLQIFFEYRPLTEKEQKSFGKNEQQRPQENLNETAVQGILKQVKNPILKALQTQTDKEQTLLLKHLTQFTRKNTSDFFIHKDLRGFLRRELDFYLKNEVLLLDELLNTENPELPTHRVLQGHVIRKVGEDIIDFLAQVEDFQRRLFVKKKFVVRTEYCLTLDRVPEALWDEVLKSKTQITEWQELFALDELLQQADKKKPDKAFLKAHQKLEVDTHHFSEDFKWQLLLHFEDLDNALDGVLIKSENFQALNLLLEKYRERVKCIYIDPPYNTGNDEFIYKDNYQHSCWIGMMENRLRLAKDLLAKDGVIFVQIDDDEQGYLKVLCDKVYGRENFHTTICVKMSHLSGVKMAHKEKKLPKIKEFVLMYTKNHGLKLKPQFEPVLWDEALERYTSFLVKDGYGDDQCEKWRVITLNQAIENSGIDRKDKKAVLDFKLKNAHLIFRTARNRSADYSHLPKEIFHRVVNPDNSYYFVYKGEDVNFASDKVIEIDGIPTPVNSIGDIWTDIGINNLSNEGGVDLRFGKKPEKLIHRIIDLTTNKGDIVLDFFLGSSTSVSVSQKMSRKWIGIESEDIFERKTKLRMQNVLFGEQTGISQNENWIGGGFFKYIYLEQYEDTLNNLELLREKDGQQTQQKFGDDYFLRYMLKFETQGSPCLLNLDMMKSPFAYRLKVQEGDETVERLVDLVETFNYLIGLHVKKMRTFENDGHQYRAVSGEESGKSVVIILRPLNGLEENKTALRRDKQFIEDSVLPTLLGNGVKPDRLLVNGACHVENAEAIELEFKRLMFREMA